MSKKCFRIILSSGLKKLEDQKRFFNAYFAKWSDVASFNGGTQFYLYAEEGPFENKNEYLCSTWEGIDFMVHPYGYWE